MMLRRRVLLATAAAVVAAGAAASAGLGLAQDQNQTANTITPPLGPATAADNTTATGETPVQANPQPLDLPPPVAAPAPMAAANATENVTADATPPPPPKRPRYPVVVLQALDKATAETLRFEAKVGEPIRYKDLVIVAQACETQASDEPYTQTAAHLEVQFQPEFQPVHGVQVARQVFSGWMFGDAPGLHPFEQPTYDLWVIACKAPSPTPAAPVPGAHL